MRAHAIAKGLGLSLVGIAYAHPPRFHAMEALELAFLARQRAKAIEADVAAAQLFVGMRFRPVYDDEPLDADVTAEVYQPTEQLCQLVLERDVVRDGGVLEGSGQLRLDAASKLEFKIGAQTQPTADASYFFARVHDLAKPYTPPAAGVKMKDLMRSVSIATPATLTSSQRGPAVAATFDVSIAGVFRVPASKVMGSVAKAQIELLRATVGVPHAMRETRGTMARSKDSISRRARCIPTQVWIP